MKFDDNNPFAPDPAQPGEPPAHASPVAETKPLFEPEQFTPATAGHSPIPEDLRVPWGWGNLMLFVLMYFILGFIVLLGFAAFGVKLADIQKFTSDKGPSLVLSQVILSLAMLGYLAAEMRYHFRLPFWRTIGWHPLETGRTPRAYAYGRYVLGGFLFSVLIQFASAAIRTKNKLPIENLFQDPHTAILLMLMAVAVAPVFEETIFRGYIYPVIARSFGVGTSIVVTGALFGMMHAPQLWPAWGQIALMIIVGIIFTYVRSLTRTVVASFLFHLGYNGFLFVVFLIASHGLHKLPGG
jgi:membrane protease YdiL (CAAX protease family)